MTKGNHGEGLSAPGGGPQTSTVKFKYHNQLAPTSSSTDLLGPLSEPSSRTSSQSRPGKRGGSGVVTFHIHNSAADQTRSISMEDVLGNSETASSEGCLSDKPSYLRLSIDQGSSSTLLPSSISRLTDLADHQIFLQLSRENIPRVLSYRPYVDTESGQKRYREVATTPSKGDIAATIRELPRSSIIDSLDLDHR